MTIGELFYHAKYRGGRGDYQPHRTKNVFRKSIGRETFTCAICGQHRGNEIAYPFKEVISSTFSAYETLQDNAPGHICMYCEAIMRKDYLGKSFIVTPTEVIDLGYKSSGVVEYILAPPEPPFAIVAGVFKKHSLYLGVVNHSADKFYVSSLDQKFLVDSTAFIEASADKGGCSPANRLISYAKLSTKGIGKK